jgi:TPR repeat protein
LEAKSGKNAASEFALGQIYESGNEILISDANKAEYWYNLAAEKGYLPAQEALAALFLKHKQKDLALQWNLKSAENGSSVGQFYSSVLLLENPSKTEEAISMLKMAVKQDYIGAYSLLGTFYLQGKHVELNVEKGMKYLKRAVPSNDPLALHNLAIAYKKGVGTRPDMERALAYFELAKAAESSNSYPQLDKKAILGDEFITTFAY